jgi:hypothetical protein
MPRIEELYAWVIEDTGPGDEGVPGFSAGHWLLPMMGADFERAQSLRDIAQDMADTAGKPIKLIRSTGIEVVEVVSPEVKV